MHQKLPKVFLALPSMNEAEYLPKLIKCIQEQDYAGNFELFVCINQPDKWWDDEEKIHICNSNSSSVQILKEKYTSPLKIIDRFSKGKGWKGKHYGVGWARKTVMDEINKYATPEDIIISIDADTTFRSKYISSVVESFKRHPSKIAMAVPYYHKLTKDDILNRNILRYEIYMRYYNLNLWRICSPYNFTALGSAIALPVWAYRKVNGISPHKSGEDFYFLQKLRKAGEIILWNKEKVFPAARYSDRVFFGTGPALIKGRDNDWSSYPIYHYSNFDDIKELYSQFHELFDHDIDSDMIKFMEKQFNTANLWNPLRSNFKNRESFVNACTHKIDGLRILQYLKAKHKLTVNHDEVNLSEYFNKFSETNELVKNDINLLNFSFDNSSIEELNKIRNFLLLKEEELQKKSYFYHS